MLEPWGVTAIFVAQISSSLHKKISPEDSWPEFGFPGFSGGCAHSSHSGDQSAALLAEQLEDNLHTVVWVQGGGSPRRRA